MMMGTRADCFSPHHTNCHQKQTAWDRLCDRSIVREANDADNPCETATHGRPPPMQALGTDGPHRPPLLATDNAPGPPPTDVQPNTFHLDSPWYRRPRFPWHGCTAGRSDWLHRSAGCTVVWVRVRPERGAAGTVETIPWGTPAATTARATIDPHVSSGCRTRTVCTRSFLQDVRECIPRCQLAHRW